MQIMMSYIKFESSTNIHCSNIVVITIELIPQSYPCNPKIGLLVPNANPFPLNYGSYTSTFDLFHVASNHPFSKDF